MRILFLPMVGGYGLGPLTQCLSIAEEARTRGHDIAFLCQASYRSFVEAEGYRVYIASNPEPNRRIIPQFFKLADAVAALGLSDVDFIRVSIKTELRTIEDFEPDILVSKIKLTAPISAKLTGLPLISTAMWADHPAFTSPLYERSDNEMEVTLAYNTVLDEYRQPAIEDIGELSFLRSDLKLAPSSPELDPLLMQVPDLYYVGFLLYKRLEETMLPKWLADWDPTIPLIYVYLGVGDISPDIYVNVLRECFDGTEFQVVVSTSNHPELPVPPGPTRNVRYSNTLPGLATMRRSRLVIHHGGASTAVGAILAGIPALMFPGSDAERDSNCRNIQRLGCGRLLASSSFTADMLLEASRRLVRDITRSDIEPLAQRLEKLGGPERAWDLAEEHFGSW